MQLMYSVLADRFHLVTAPADYAPEAVWIRELLDRYAAAPVRTLLELGSGGGNNAVHLKRHYRMTLTDLSARMLETSRTINPELPHIVGDMRTLRLRQTFDAVFIHDAIVYMTTAADVRAALATARAHLAAGGVLIVQPDHLLETFEPTTDWGGDDAPDGSGLRFLEWSHPLEADGHTCRVDYVYALRAPDGKLEVLHETHVEGVFGQEAWFDMLRATGFAPDAVPDPPELESGGRVTLIGVAV